MKFHIVEAYYVWLCAHHDGRGYPKQHPRYWCSYGRLSMMGQAPLYFHPRVNLNWWTLSVESRDIYRDLCRRLNAQGIHCDCEEVAALKKGC